VLKIKPSLHLHAFSPDEVCHAISSHNLSSAEVLRRLKGAGLGSLQGPAAEILVDSVRKVICPRKLDTAEWVRIIKEAHALGIPSTATIMYGSYETARDRAEHLEVLRSIQDETHGFTELVPLSYLRVNTPLYKAGVTRAAATGREDLLMIAVSRRFLDNFDNIQVPWGKLGLKMTQTMLLAGGNDLAGICSQMTHLKMQGQAMQSTRSGDHGTNCIRPWENVERAHNSLCTRIKAKNNARTRKKSNLEPAVFKKKDIREVRAPAARSYRSESRALWQTGLPP
jgi:CofH subfamily radical SAM domain protein